MAISTQNDICFNRLSIGALPVSYLESLSYEEQLLYLQKVLNDDFIPALNTCIEKVNNIDVNFDELQEQIDTLNTNFTTLQTRVEQIKTEIDTDVQNQLTQQYNKVVQLMTDYQTIFNENLNIVKTDLENQISQIELGNVKAYDPTTGEYNNVSVVIQNVYDALRAGAITCSEFDALELTATEFDSKEITAFNFDLNGKTILMQ